MIRRLARHRRVVPRARTECPSLFPHRSSHESDETKNCRRLRRIWTFIQRYLRALAGLFALAAPLPVVERPPPSPPPPAPPLATPPPRFDPPFTGFFSTCAAPSENAMSSTACTARADPPASSSAAGAQSNVVRSGASSSRFKMFSDLYRGLRSPSAAATRA